MLFRWYCWSCSARVRGRGARGEGKRRTRAKKAEASLQQQLREQTVHALYLDVRLHLHGLFSGLLCLQQVDASSARVGCTPSLASGGALVPAGVDIV